MDKLSARYIQGKDTSVLGFPDTEDEFLFYGEIKLVIYDRKEFTYIAVNYGILVGGKNVFNEKLDE